MRLFSPLYQRVMQWSRHDKAPWFLGGLSFAESSFFPIPPDVMLAPMSMAKPTSAMWYATLTTITSVFGGMAGYLIGVFAFDMIQPIIAESARYSAAYESATLWFADYGVWAILIAGFSPIPYKIFTITAGVVGMAFLPFVIASVIGRGARFYLVALLMAWGGPAMEEKLNRWVDGLGWAVVVLVIAAIVYLRG